MQIFVLDCFILYQFVCLPFVSLPDCLVSIRMSVCPSDKRVDVSLMCVCMSVTFLISD